MASVFLCKHKDLSTYKSILQLNNQFQRLMKKITKQNIINFYQHSIRRALAFATCLCLTLMILIIPSVGLFFENSLNSLLNKQKQDGIVSAVTVDTWDGTLPSVNIEYTFNGQTGLDKANAYQINTAQDLMQLAVNVNNGEAYEGKYFILNVDVDLNNNTSFTSIGNDINPFSGSFDGNSHSILNISINNDAVEYGALFGYVTNTISNLTVTGSISAFRYVGGIVAYVNSTGNVLNCVNKVSVSGLTVNSTVTVDAITDGCVGGVVGYNGGIVQDCTNTGLVSGVYSSIGGIVGFNDTNATVNICTNQGEVNCNENVNGIGGIAGTNNATVTDCKNSGQITGLKTSAGIVGINNDFVTKCSNSGTITCGNSYAGIVGLNNKTVSYCYNKGEIIKIDSGSQCYAGGVVGNNGGDGSSISYCFNMGNVNGCYASGGILGYVSGTNSTVSNVYSIATINCSGFHHIGGLIGQTGDCTVTNAYVVGRVSGAGSVGGVFGSDYSASSTSITGTSVNTYCCSAFMTTCVGTSNSSNIHATALGYENMVLSTGIMQGIIDNTDWVVQANEGTTYHFPQLSYFVNNSDAEIRNDSLLSVSIMLESKLIFDANGGMGEMASVSYPYYEQNKILPANEFTKTGYNFDGWVINGGTIVYEDRANIASATLKLNSTDTLSCLWRAKEYIVILDPQNGQVADLPRITTVYDRLLSPISSLPTKTGYDFDGYYTQPNGAGIKYFDNAGVGQAIWTTDTENVTLYANWIAKKYSIIFYNEAITDNPSMSNLECEYDKSTNLTLNTYTKSLTISFDTNMNSLECSPYFIPYEFLGWSKTLGGEIAYQDGESVTNLSSDGTSVALFACWQMNLQTKYYFPSLEKEGYELNGWTFEEGSTMVFAPGEEIVEIGEMTYYASWTKIFLPTPEPTEEEKEEQKIQDSVVTNEDGTFSVDGKFSNGETYDTPEEALIAAKENNEKEKSEQNVGDFVQETLSGLPGEEVDFEDKYAQALKDLEKTDDGKMKVGDKEFDNIEDALAEIVVQVKTEILEEKKTELVSIVTDMIHTCDGEKINLAVNHKAAEIKDVTLDGSADLSSIYASALDNVNVLKAVQNALNKIADEYNKALESRTFTDESISVLHGHWEQFNEELQLCETHTQINDYLSRWAEFVGELKLISVKQSEEDSTQGIVTSEQGIDSGVTLVIAQIDDYQTDLYDRILDAINSGDIVSDSNLPTALIESIISNRSIKGVYDVSLVKDGATITAKGTYNVKLLLPESCKGIGRVSIVHIDQEGKVEYIDAKVIDGYAVFEVTHFSEFVILGQDPAPLGYMAIPAVILLGLIVAYIVVSKKETK